MKARKTNILIAAALTTLVAVAILMSNLGFPESLILSGYLVLCISLILIDACGTRKTKTYVGLGMIAGVLIMFSPLAFVS